MKDNFLLFAPSAKPENSMKQLFKYLPEPRNLFQEGFIRLSQLSALNDPFEASFCKKSLDELALNFDDENAYDPEFGTLSFSQYIEKRMQYIGVISFSENKENLLMWAHYANEHKGIIAGIVQISQSENIFHNLFRADQIINTSLSIEHSLFDGIAKPVAYRKGLRYRNDKFDYDYSNISVEGAGRILYEVFMQKSDEWIYEQEYRVVLRLEQADRVIVSNIEAIDSIKIFNRFRSNPNFSITPNGEYVIDLWKFEDEIERIILANALVELSVDRSTIFLMKLSSSSINNCLIGLNSSLSMSDIVGGFASETGYLDVWKAKRNLDYYSLDFEEISSLSLT